MFITTLMVTIVALIVWRLPVAIVIIGFIIFAFIDGVFLSSSLVKIAEGAWVTLALAAVLSSLFILWRFGKETQWLREGSLLSPLSDLLDFSKPTSNFNRDQPTSNLNGDQQTQFSAKKEEVSIAISSPSRPGPLSRSQLNHIKALAIFFDKSGSPYTAPAVFTHFIRKFHACPEVVMFLHLRPLPVPSVAPEDRYHISRCFGSTSPESLNGNDDFANSLNGFRLTIRHGYTDEVVTRDLGMLAYEQLRAFLIQEACDTADNTRKEDLPDHDTNDKDKQTDTTRATTGVIQSRHRSLAAAYNSQIIYILGNEQLRLKRLDRDNESGESTIVSFFAPSTLFRRVRAEARRFPLSIFLWLRENARQKVSNWDLEVERVVEVGFVCEI